VQLLELIKKIITKNVTLFVSSEIGLNCLANYILKHIVRITSHATQTIPSQLEHFIKRNIQTVETNQRNKKVYYCTNILRQSDTKIILKKLFILRKIPFGKFLSKHDRYFVSFNKCNTNLSWRHKILGISHTPKNTENLKIWINNLFSFRKIWNY
jgi:hypothetical protein